MTATPPSKTADKPPSVWEDLLEVVYAPRAVFQRREKYVAFGLAMVILTVVSTAIFFGVKSTLEPVFDATVKQQVAEVLRQNPQLKEEQVAGMTGWMRGSIAGIILIAPVLLPFLAGLCLWLVGKFFDSKAGPVAAIMVATYAYVPRVLGFVASGIMALVLPEDQLKSFFSISFSPARLVDQDATSPGLLGLLARADIFIFWQVAIQTIGLSVLGKISTGKAAAIAIIVWLLGMLPLVPAILKG